MPSKLLNRPRVLDPICTFQVMDLGNNRRAGRESNIPGPSFSTLIDGTRAHRRRFSRRKAGLRRRGKPSGSIPGNPGTDFPTFNSIPATQFNCLNGNGGARQPGFYADVEAQCQVRIISFCPLVAICPLSVP